MFDRIFSNLHFDDPPAGCAGRDVRPSLNSVRPLLRAALLLLTVFCAPCAMADQDAAVRLLKIIPIPGATPFRAFDISWFDAPTQRFYIADRSNAAVDVIDARAGTFIKSIQGGFAGVKFNGNGTANNNISGPNGVVVAGHWLFVTDAGSRVVSIDLRNDAVVSSVNTSTSGNRADELAYDPADGVLLVINNADTPPFGTLISVDKPTGHLTVGTAITLDAAHVGFDATNGAEQPQWDKGTGKFYLSIPEINCNSGPTCGGADSHGAVVRIDAHSTGIVDAVYPVELCQPAGLTVGPDDQLLVGCSVVFDTTGKAWSGSDANTAAPASVILSASSGAVIKRVHGASGSDEVWYNHGDGHYYLAARNNSGGPVLGVIDAQSQTLMQLVPTINTAGNATIPYPSGSSHSVAVDSVNNHALVPLPANNVFPSCLNGCIGVFGAPRGE